MAARSTDDKCARLLIRPGTYLARRSSRWKCLWEISFYCLSKSFSEPNCRQGNDEGSLLLQPMLGPRRRRNAAPCSTVTSQLVPSVMICAWIFFFMSKRGEETRKAATFVCTGQYAVHTRRAETDKLSLAVLPRPSRSYIHTHKLSLSLSL